MTTADRESRLDAIREAAASGRVTSPGYHGAPLLKPPVWTWEVPVYFFVGGTAGAASVIAGIASLFAGHDVLARDARLIAAIGALLSPVLLILDLGRPERFLHMLRVFKRRSPMSVGAWTLVAFSSVAVVACAVDLLAANAMATSSFVVTIGRVAGALAVPAGLALATYTGVLLGATAIPVWSRHVRFLPVLFGMSGLAAAVSLLELLGHRTPTLNAMGIAACAVEVALGLPIAIDRDAGNMALRSGRSGIALRSAEAMSGAVPLILRVLWPTSWLGRTAAAIVTLAGSLLTRIGWILAGRTSAADHKSVLGDAVPGKSSSTENAVPRKEQFHGKGGSATTVILALTLGAGAVSAASQQPTARTDEKSVVEAARRYVADYQEQLTYVVADEVATQEARDADGRVAERRLTRAEIVFMFLPAEHRWIAVRRVTEVDGAKTPDTPELIALLSKQTVLEVSRAIREANSRYNIGHITRDFNEPTLALLVLDARARSNFSFDRQAVTRSGETTLVTMNFKEIDRPTIVYNLESGPVYSTGSLVIEAGTGRIQHSRIAFAVGSLRAEHETDYVQHDTLKMLVPSVFRERYERTKGAKEVVTCESRYENYRKFDVTGRIK